MLVKGCSVLMGDNAHAHVHMAMWMAIMPVKSWEDFHFQSMWTLDPPRWPWMTPPTLDVIFSSTYQIIMLSTQLLKGKPLLAHLTWPQRGQHGQSSWQCWIWWWWQVHKVWPGMMFLLLESFQHYPTRVLCCSHSVKRFGWSTLTCPFRPISWLKINH